MGFVVVIVFLALAYWQLSSHYDDTNNLKSLNEYENLLKVSISDINNLSEFQYIQIDDNISLIDTWLLRSRVHNGQNGYNRIDLISDSFKNYMVVNRGWVPLDFDLDSINKFEDVKYIGKLMNYDTQTVGQDDIPNSNYLFRIDNLFIENEKNINFWGIEDEPWILAIKNLSNHTPEENVSILTIKKRNDNIYNRFTAYHFHQELVDEISKSLY